MLGKPHAGILGGPESRKAGGIVSGFSANRITIVPRPSTNAYHARPDRGTGGDTRIETSERTGCAPDGNGGSRFCQDSVRIPSR